MAEAGMIPDTLLLEDRAALAINAILGMADEGLDGIPFFSANLVDRPARMRHGDYDYGSSHGRFIDALILARHMTGCEEGQAIEERYRRNFLSFFGEDGLSYRRTHPRGHWGPTAQLIDQRAVILALTTWYLSTGDSAVRRVADRHVAALKRIAVKERDVWYYPSSEYTSGGWPSANMVALRLAPDPATMCGRLIMPLLKYHELTGNPDAFELCRFFTNLIVGRSGVFNEDGSFNDSLAYRSGHFHTRLGTLEGLARFAAFTGDHALTAFVRRSFDWALTRCTAFGWTPGDMQEQQYEHETCSLVDLIGIGTALARSGHRSYWGVVERFVRNHLAESQLLATDWVEDAPDASLDEPGWITHVGVSHRVRGAFAGYGSPNDYACDVELGRGHTNDVQACCIGSGTRAVFTAWSNRVTEERGSVRVNLLLSGGGRCLDVSSHLPHEGRVELTAKRDMGLLEVRVPAWAGYAKVRTLRGGGEEVSGAAPSTWQTEGFLSLRDVAAGERITITFPVPEATTVETAAGRTYVTRWRGDDVIGITPEGTHHPLYSGRRALEAAPMRAGSYRQPPSDLVW